MRGFTLIEVLIAMLVAMVVTGALFRLLDPAQLMVQPQLEAADVQQRLRVGVDALMRDLLMAGAGRSDQSDPGPLSQSTATVLPYRHGLLNDDPAVNVFYRPDTITVRYTPTSSDQSTIESHTYYAKPDAASGALQLMHYNGASGDFPVVDNVVHLSFAYFGDPAPPVSIGAPGPGVDSDPVDEYPAGENCLFVRVNGDAVPRLPRLADGTGMQSLDATALTDGPWCPNAAAADRFDADLLRVRRIHVRLRVQAGNAGFRGPAGALYGRGGIARHSLRLVPDADVQFDVTPRNLNTGR
jgi:prepilin-type N-terminal cleavage/methylation domain-containing protein